MDQKITYSASWKQSWPGYSAMPVFMNKQHEQSKKQIAIMESQDDITDVAQALKILTDIKNKSS